MKQVNELNYIEINNEISIIKYMGENKEVIIPNIIDDKLVTSIGEEAFRDCNFITKIVIPDSIRKIGNYSFCNCNGLREFDFGDGVIYIGNHAFYNCRGLKEIKLTGGVDDIGDGAFKNCYNMNRLVIRAKGDKLKSIRSIIDGLSQDIILKIYYNNEEETKVASLVMPKDAVFFSYYTNRINDQTRFGVGNQYHYCIGDGNIDYEKYDSLFLGARNELSEDVLKQIALLRILYPYKLQTEFKEKYRTYLDIHIINLVKESIVKNELDLLKLMAKESLMEESHMDEFIDYARECNRVECASFFITYKNKYFNKRNTSFSL